MVNRDKIKNTMSVVLKRELTDNEKNELIYLKDNNDDEFFKKYATKEEKDNFKSTAFDTLSDEDKDKYNNGQLDDDFFKKLYLKT